MFISHEIQTFPRFSDKSKPFMEIEKTLWRDKSSAPYPLCGKASLQVYRYVTFVLPGSPWSQGERWESQLSSLGAKPGGQVAPVLATRSGLISFHYPGLKGGRFTVHKDNPCQSKSRCGRAGLFGWHFLGNSARPLQFPYEVGSEHEVTWRFITWDEMNRLVFLSMFLQSTAIFYLYQGHTWQQCIQHKTNKSFPGHYLFHSYLTN